MNELGALLLEVAARGVAFACVGLGLCIALGRRGPGASATAALATLVGLVGVSALGASPWPSWWSLTPDRAGVEPLAGAETSLPTLPARAGAGASGTARPPGFARSLPDPAPVSLLREFGRALMRPGPAAEGRGWGWRGWLAAGVMAGVGVGLARFALGLAAVAALRARSVAVDAPGLLAEADRLREGLGIIRPVEIRASVELATPATIGHVRPIVLLPTDWNVWDEQERKVALSHELAHVRNGDYARGLWAGLSLALHFYNPLAHRLASRLRLEQELAADAWGARLSGGNRPYLATLARMALRRDLRPVGWPARSFRPPRGTFSRRIEMLRDTVDRPHATPTTLPRRDRALTLGVLSLAGLALLGLRGPGSETWAQAPTPPPAAAATQPGADIGYIPADAGAMVVIRPAALLARPEFARLLAILGVPADAPGSINLPPPEIDQATFFWNYEADHRTGGRSPTGILIRTTRPQDWKVVAGTFLADPEEVRFGDRAYWRGRAVPGGTCYATPDATTLLIGAEPILQRMLVSPPGATDRAPWAGAWKAVKKGQLAVALDPTWLLIKLQQDQQGAQAGRPSPLGPYLPLLTKATGYAVGVDAGPTLAIDGLATCGSGDAAEGVAETLKASLVLLRNSLDALSTQMARMQDQRLPVAARVGLDTAIPLLARTTVRHEGATVRFGSTSDRDIATLLNALVPALVDARAAAKRSQSINNLKQIGLALHNYASANGKFPPPMVVGPDGKTLHSWRVAILPYLEQQELYNAYRQDEPWDSENNRKILKKIPAVFRHPDAKPGTSASYFAITGPEAIFSGTAGCSLETILDGTSNTVMVVEADREIPWTKPEDIGFAPVGPPPKLGGYSADGFNALFSDGSVRFLKGSISPIVLRALFTKAGGEVISQDAF